MLGKLSIPALVLFHTLLSAISVAQVSRDVQNASLAGIIAFKVSVEINNSSDTQTGLPTEQLQTDIERKLQAAGIRATTQTVWIDSVGYAQLFVEVNALKYNATQSAYTARTSVIQKASLDRLATTRATLAETWSTAVMGVVGIGNLAGKIREQVSVQIDQLVISYRTMNPPPAK